MRRYAIVLRGDNTVWECLERAEDEAAMKREADENNAKIFAKRTTAMLERFAKIDETAAEIGPITWQRGKKKHGCLHGRRRGTHRSSRPASISPGGTDPAVSSGSFGAAATGSSEPATAV